MAIILGLQVRSVLFKLIYLVCILYGIGCSTPKVDLSFHSKFTPPFLGEVGIEGKITTIPDTCPPFKVSYYDKDGNLILKQAKVEGKKFEFMPTKIMRNTSV